MGIILAIVICGVLGWICNKGEKEEIRRDERIREEVR